MTPRIDWAGLILPAVLALAGFAVLVLWVWVATCEYVRWRDRRGPRTLPQRTRSTCDDPPCSVEDSWYCPRHLALYAAEQPLDDQPAWRIAQAAARLKRTQP